MKNEKNREIALSSQRKRTNGEFCSETEELLLSERGVYCSKHTEINGIFTDGVERLGLD